MSSIDSIKSTLLTLYKEGKTEDEAYNEIVQIHSSNSISKKTASKWYQIFKSQDPSPEDSTKVVKEKLTDEYLINLIKDNPELSTAELARLADTSYFNLRKRIIQLNNEGKNVYKFKDLKKVSDEFIIELVNNNPNLNLAELAKLANITSSAISNRINLINSSGKKINYVKKNFCTKSNERPVQKFTDDYLINLVNENPGLNMRELADITGVCVSTISRRIKRINRLSDKANYRKKDIIKITDEGIIDLVNENPNLGMEELARLAGISIETISIRVNQLKDKGKPLNYVNKNVLEFNPETYSKPGPKQKFTDEYLINLIKQNPGLSKMELAKLAKVSYKTMITRIKQISKVEKY